MQELNLPGRNPALSQNIEKYWIPTFVGMTDVKNQCLGNMEKIYLMGGTMR